MVHNLTYSTDILDAFGVLSSFSFADTIWTKYEEYAIPKIEEANLKLRGALFYIKDLTPEQAQKELKSLDQIIPILCKFQSMLEPIEDREFKHFKVTAIEFFDTVDLLHHNLQDVALIHRAYEMSMPALSVDWDSEEDEHWDKY